MPFTTLDIVKKHLLERSPGLALAENEGIILTGTDYLQLKTRAISIASEKVKGKEQHNPTKEEINFSADDNFNLSHSELITESVVVASDSSLGTVYVENVDYHINYGDGIITRLATGSIPDNAQVIIWYLYFRVYEKDADYGIDYAKGKIRRFESGDIESGQRLFIDYRSDIGGLNDEIIENAITEANNQILTFIDSTYHDSSDKLLTDAETYLVVSILCRIYCLNSINSGIELNNSEKFWIELSETYRKNAYDFLSKFTPKSSNVNPPAKA